MGLSHRIKKRRIELGLQAKTIAQRIGVPLSTYSDWENGRQIRGEDNYLKLCEALSMSLAELFAGKKKEDLEEQLRNIENSVKIIRSLG